MCNILQTLKWKWANYISLLAAGWKLFQPQKAGLFVFKDCQAGCESQPYNDDTQSITTLCQKESCSLSWLCSLNVQSDKCGAEEVVYRSMQGRIITAAREGGTQFVKGRYTNDTKSYDGRSVATNDLNKDCVSAKDICHPYWIYVTETFNMLWLKSHGQGFSLDGHNSNLMDRLYNKKVVFNLMKRSWKLGFSWNHLAFIPINLLLERRHPITRQAISKHYITLLITKSYKDK